MNYLPAFSLRFLIFSKSSLLEMGLAFLSIFSQSCSLSSLRKGLIKVGWSGLVFKLGSILKSYLSLVVTKYSGCSFLNFSSASFSFGNTLSSISSALLADRLFTGRSASVYGILKVFNSFYYVVREVVRLINIMLWHVFQFLILLTLQSYAF